MKFNFHTEKKDPTEVNNKLGMNNSNVKVEVKDVEIWIQKQNTIQHVEESVQLKKPSGLFILNGHVVRKSMLIWMFIVTTWRLFIAVTLTGIGFNYTGLYSTNNDDFQLDLEICSILLGIVGLMIIQISIKMFRGSCSKRSKSMCLIFAAMGFFNTIRSMLLILTTNYKFPEFKTEELLSLLNKEFFFKFSLIVIMTVVTMHLDYLAMLKFWRSLGVDECPLHGRDPKVIKDRPRQKFSNWDWSLIIIILGLGGSILPNVLCGAVSSLQAFETFSVGVMFTILTCATFRSWDFKRKMKADLKK